MCKCANEREANSSHLHISTFAHCGFAASHLHIAAQPLNEFHFQNSNILKRAVSVTAGAGGGGGNAVENIEAGNCLSKNRVGFVEMWYSAHSAVHQTPFGRNRFFEAIFFQRIQACF